MVRRAEARAGASSADVEEWCNAAELDEDADDDDGKVEAADAVATNGSRSATTR